MRRHARGPQCQALAITRRDPCGRVKRAHGDVYIVLVYIIYTYIYIHILYVDIYIYTRNGYNAWDVLIIFRAGFFTCFQLYTQKFTIFSSARSTSFQLFLSHTSLPHMFTRKKYIYLYYINVDSEKVKVDNRESKKVRRE